MPASQAVLGRQKQWEELPQSGATLAQLPASLSWSEAVLLPAVPVHGWTTMLGPAQSQTHAPSWALRT